MKIIEQVQPRIHIIEDDTSVRTALEAVLTVEGMLVCAWHDGLSFLQNARISHSDVVILDLALPGLTGTAVAEELRQRASGVRIIVLTGANAENYARAKDIIKPFASYRKPGDMQALLDSVRAAIRLSPEPSPPSSDS